MKINFYKGDLPASFKATNIIALDSETMGLNPKRDKLCLVQISNGDEVCHLVKIDLSTEKPVNLIKILKKDKEEIERFSKTIEKHNFNEYNNHKFGTVNSFLPTLITMFVFSILIIFRKTDLPYIN